MLIHFGDMAPTCEVKRYKLAGEKKCAAHFYVLYVEAEVNGEKRTLLVYYYLLSYKTSYDIIYYLTKLRTPILSISVWVGRKSSVIRRTRARQHSLE